MVIGVDLINSKIILKSLSGVGSMYIYDINLNIFDAGALFLFIILCKNICIVLNQDAPWLISSIFIIRYFDYISWDGSVRERWVWFIDCSHKNKYISESLYLILSTKTMFTKLTKIVKWTSISVIVLLYLKKDEISVKY